MTQKFTPRDLRAVAVPLYVGAFMLAFMPLIELGAQLGFTGRPDNLQWRTGTIGLFSSALLTPAFGLLVAIATSFVVGHTTTHRVLTWLSGIVAVALLLIVSLFVLDALQLRSSLSAQVKRSFTLATMKAVMNFCITIGGLSIVFIGGLRAARRDRLARASRGEAGEVPLLVRR